MGRGREGARVVPGPVAWKRGAWHARLPWAGREGPEACEGRGRRAALERRGGDRRRGDEQTGGERRGDPSPPSFAR